MPKITTQIDIDAPADAVWELMNQPARYPEFAVPADKMLDIGDGVVGEGYTYKEHGGIPPFKSDSACPVSHRHRLLRLARSTTRCSRTLASCSV